MFCRQAHILITKRQREILPPEQETALARHLETCHACAEEQRAIRSLTAQILPASAEASRPALSAARRDAIWNAVRPTETFAARNGFRATGWMLAAATVLLVALGLRFMFAPTSGTNKNVIPQIAKDTTGSKVPPFLPDRKKETPPESPDVPQQKRGRDLDIPHLVKGPSPNKRTPLQEHRPERTPQNAPGVSDTQYLNGTESSLASYWTTGKQTPFSELVEKPGIPFRDDFVSTASSRLASAQGAAGAAAAQEEIKKAAQVVDSRLVRKVTLAEKDASLEEICAKLKKLIGVHLAAGQGVQDEKATVFVKDKPARDVMRSLARLFGYTWERSGEEGAYFYYFKQPLRAQLAEEEMRSRDEHEAFLALDEEMQKIAASDEKDAIQEQRHPYWWVARLYSHLSPADRTALVNGEKMEFTPTASNPDRRMTRDMREPLLKAWDMHLLESNGIKHFGEKAFLSSNTQDLGAAATMPDAMPAAMLEIDRSELGVLKLRASHGVYLASEKGLLGRPGYRSPITPIATGRSAFRKKPNNAKDNLALKADPLFQQQADLKVKSSCTARPEPSQGNEFVFHVDEVGKVVQGEEDPHLFAGDVWEAIHAQTGLSIVADSYLQAYPAAEVRTSGISLFDAVCRTADALNLRLRKEGDFLLCRSASYVWDKLKEVPARSLRQWQQDRETQGYLPLEDVLDMARLSDRQLDSIPVGKVLQHCLGLREWGMIGKGDFRPGNLMPESLRDYMRFFAELPPPIRAAALQPDGVALTDLPQQAQQAMLKLGMLLYQNNLPVFTNGRLHCDYVPAGHYYWQPVVNHGDEKIAQQWPVVSGKTEEETLAAIHRFLPDAVKEQIKRSRGLFVLTVKHPNGDVLRFGLYTFFRVP